MTQSVVGALRVVLGIDTAQFEKGVTAAQKHLRDVSRSWEQTGQRMMTGGAVMSAAITAPFIALMATSRTAAVESRQAIGQVETAQRSMGNASGRTTKQLQDQAKALQGLSTVDDDDILRRLTANMVTFGRVSGDVFDRAQLAALNLSARMDGDLQAAALMVGKALNAPTQGLTALRRAGIQFTDQQKSQIKAMEKSGNLAGAQRIMLAELERQFGGSAKAMRDATPDAAQVDQWREMSETVGEMVINVLPPLVGALTTVMAAFNHLSPEMQATVVGGVAIAAALGPVVTVMGAVVSAGGGLIGLLSKVGGVTATGAAGTSLLARAMGGLRASMLFLVTTPWALLIAGVAAAVGLLVWQSQQAGPAQKELAKQTKVADEALRKYEEAAQAAAVATGAARIEAKKHEEQMRRDAIAAVNKARSLWQTAQALRAVRLEEQRKSDEALNNPILMSGPYAGAGQASVQLGRQAAVTQAAAEERAAAAEYRRQAAELSRIERDARAGASIVATPAPAIEGSPAGGGADQQAREADQRRRTIQDMAHQNALEEAQLRNDLDRVRVLEREGAVRERTRALVDAGIMKDAAAAVEAERVQQRLDAALDDQIQREERVARRDFERQLWEIDGRQEMINKIEREVMLEERIAYWRSKGRDLVTATSTATSELLEMDLARAEAAERSAVAAQREHNIELARLRGDDREGRRLSRLAEIDDRARRYQTDRDNPLSPTDARARAEREVAELDDAEMTGRVRDFVKEGWQAAMDGDLTDFARKWVMEWAGRGLEDALNGLADLLMQIFKSTDWSAVFGGGKGDTGGGFWSGIGDALSSVMGNGTTAKVPGFANGGSILPGGSGGIDSQLVQFRKSPGERVDIYTPGKDAGASGGGPVHFDLRGAVVTADLLRQMEGMAAASGGAAYQGARQTVPNDMAYAGRYSRGR